jgi:hypothetical protein
MDIGCAPFLSGEMSYFACMFIAPCWLNPSQLNHPSIVLYFFSLAVSCNADWNFTNTKDLTEVAYVGINDKSL